LRHSCNEHFEIAVIDKEGLLLKQFLEIWRVAGMVIGLVCIMASEAHAGAAAESAPLVE
jgi:hypothetical protein